MNIKLERKHICYIILLFLGITLRFFVMTLGHNFDFESYCIVGDIIGNGRNVYAETSRYNYGPIFFLFQGAFHNIAVAFSQINNVDWEVTYRVLIVSLLTFTDLGIAFFIASRYSLKSSLIFFLNPISIIISGYHNQFDNIAVLLALITIIFYNEEKKFSYKDVFFVLFMTLCLTTKHILFLFPFFLLISPRLSFKKRIVYSTFPPAFFLLSFIPFCINPDGLQGIITHVFLYRSSANSPLLCYFYDAVNFPSALKLIVYMLCVIATAFVVRNKSYEYQLLIYLIAMVCFASSMANQYLAIPLVALVLLDTKFFKYIYFLLIGVYLILHSNGLNLLGYTDKNINKFVYTVMEKYSSHGFIMAAWLLFITLLFILFYPRISKKLALPGNTSSCL